MIESPFGSASQAWSAMPLITGWPPVAPPLTPIQNRPPGAAFTPQPMPPPAALGLGAGAGLPFAPNPFAFAAGFPGMLPPAPPTISTLLMSVAIRRGQPAGPTNDQEIEDFIYDVLEMLPGTNEVEVRSESGKATLTGGVQHKRLKHDVGEVVWSIPNVNDVQNNITISTKRRARGVREQEQQSAAAGQGRKQP